MNSILLKLPRKLSVFLISLCLLLSSCAKEKKEFIDLTNMSSIMVDSYLANMISNNDNYMGKTVNLIDAEILK